LNVKVGLIPLLAVNVMKTEDIDKLIGFKRRMDWFLQNRTGILCFSLSSLWVLSKFVSWNGSFLLSDLSRHISWMSRSDSREGEAARYLLAVPSKQSKSLSLNNSTFLFFSFSFCLKSITQLMALKTNKLSIWGIMQSNV
jgi:hypothetical protein